MSKKKKGRRPQAQKQQQGSSTIGQSTKRQQQRPRRLFRTPEERWQSVLEVAELVWGGRYYCVGSEKATDDDIES